METLQSSFLLQRDAALINEAQGAGRWLHVVSHLDSRYGGISAIVPQLCSTLSAEIPVSLAAFCNADETSDSENREYVTSFFPMSRMAWLQQSRWRFAFRRTLESVDAVHIHGLWEQSTFMAARIARQLGKPYIISAHGMLERWALHNKRVKKALYARLFERANVCGAACLHALTAAEAEDYRRFGCEAPIAVIPNGVSAPGVMDSKLFLDRFPQLVGRRILLFLGRIHFKKGLDILVEAWKSVAARFPDATLVLAGPDSEHTRAAIQKLIDLHGLHSQTCFTGMLENEMKWSSLAAASCFILPSYSEGLSTAALEAMACGVPVILTPQCNIPEVEKAGCGWLVESKSTSLAYSIEQMLTASAERLAEMGESGKVLVKERYSRAAVAHQMLEMYRWVVNDIQPAALQLRFS